jgi:2-oxoglutarate dehydrogenase E2 component (dihydrolipoamide succinyltransferase)
VVSLGGVQREVSRTVTTVGVAYDHRVVNGREAVQFLQELKKDARECRAAC